MRKIIIIKREDYLKMDRNQTLEAIEKARNSHQSQMSKIEKLIEGEDVETPTAVAKTQCAFGKWLYAKENHLEDILGSLFFTNLEKQHAQWHSEYVRVHEIFFNENRKKGFFSALLGTNKIDDLEIDKAKLYYKELQDTTNELLHTLASCERRVSAMSDSKFEF